MFSKLSFLHYCCMEIKAEIMAKAQPLAWELLSEVQFMCHFPAATSRKSVSCLNQFLMLQGKSLMVELIIQNTGENHFFTGKPAKVHGFNIEENLHNWKYPFFHCTSILIHSSHFNQTDNSNPKYD